MIASSKKFYILSGIIVSILLVPFTAMQFSDEVNWTVLDFVVAGLLLFGTGLLLDFIWRKTVKNKWRIFLITGVVFAFLLIWTQLAVGLL